MPAAAPGHNFGSFAAAKFLSCTGSAKISGTFGLDVSGVTASFARWTGKDKSKQFKASLGWQTTVSAAVDVTADTDCTPGRALRKIAVAFVIDGVTVALHPDFELKISAAGEVSASQTTGQSVTVSGRLGLAVPAVAYRMTPQKPRVSASGTVVFDALVGARADVSAGVVGLEFQLMGGLHATVAAASGPPGVCVSGYPELLITGTFLVTFAGWHKQVQFYDHTWPITSVAGHSTRFSNCPSAPWKATEAPLPAGAASLGPGPGGLPPTALACASVSVCAAARSYLDSAGNQQGLLLTRSGALWKAVNAPVPVGAGANPTVTLTAMACPSVGVCVVTGSYVNSARLPKGLLLTRSGTSWTAVEAPLPAGASADDQASLAAVACPSASSCVAVGRYTAGTGALVLTRAGTSWKAAQAPLPPGASATDPQAALYAVACPSVSACVAIGSYLDSQGHLQGLLLTGWGTKWTAAKAPLPGTSSPGGDVTAVACPSASLCVAAGLYVDSSDQIQGLLLTGWGTRWAAKKAPLPPDASNPEPSLNSVACPTMTFCVVAGDYNSTSGPSGLILTGSGTSWTAAKAPLPAGATGGVRLLSAVSCPTAASCIAVGVYVDSSGGFQGLLLTRSGTSWTAAKAALPVGAAHIPQASLQAVTCPSSSSCVAAGFYNDSSGNFQGLLLTGSS
jgi:hypothetical protein